MKVVYLGTYDRNYARNAINIGGLKLNNVDIIECHTSLRGLRKFADIYRKYVAVATDVDAVIVGFLGQSVVPFAWFLTRFVNRKLLILDAFLSLYDSNVFDRKIARKYSIRGFYNYFLDLVSMHLADIVLFDTFEHIRYASSTFFVSPKKFRRIPIGANDSIFNPKSYLDSLDNNKKKIILFYGTYIPLQGIEYIVDAANLLRDREIYRFVIIGNGQTQKEIKLRAYNLKLNNIDFIDAVKQEELVKYIASADVCLGIFGNTNKTKRVIPNKLYESLAMNKAVITGDTKAVREFFDERDLMFARVADSVDLANKIDIILSDDMLRANIANSGYKKYIAKTSMRTIGMRLVNIINSQKYE